MEFLESEATDQNLQEIPSGKENLEIRPWISLVVASSSIFLMTLDLGLTAVSLPEIRADFAESKRQIINWGATSYLVAMTSLLLLFGRLSDRYGRRKLFLIGLSITTMAVSLAAFTPNPEIFLIARTFQGAGIAILVPTALAMVLGDIPQKHQGAAVGLWGSIGATAGVLGPISSGSLIEFFGWRATFALLGILGILALVAGMRVLNESYLPEVPENLDLISVFSGIISIGSVTLILLQGNDWGWFSKKIIFLFLLGVLVSCIFWISCRYSRNPLLDLELFKNHKYRQATLAAGFHQVAFFAFFFSSPILLSEVWGWSPMKTGFAVAPAMLLAILVQTPFGILADRFGYRKLILYGGFVPSLGITWWLFFVDFEPSYSSAFLPGLLVVSLGSAMVGITTTGVALTVVETRKLGIANAMHQVSRRLGTTMGVALAVGLGSGSNELEILENIKVLWCLVAFMYAAGSIFVWKSDIK
jgi:EmrB/QacA subfamily drug resistance transporter